MSLGRSDRQAVLDLHEIANGVSTTPRNLRNMPGGASSSSNPQGKWTKPETLIRPPGMVQRAPVVGKGNPYTAQSIRSSVKTRKSGSEREEYAAARPNKRPRVVDKYQSPTGPIYKNSRGSPHFWDGGAGRNISTGGRGKGKAAMRGRGPARSTRIDINLNQDVPESIEVGDSEEDREQSRKAEREASKRAGKQKATSVEVEDAGDKAEDDDGDITVTSGPTSRVTGPFDFDAAGHDRSSGTPPATISIPRMSKAASVFDEEDELDVIGGDEAHAGPSTSRVTAALRDTPIPSTSRAPTRLPAQPVSSKPVSAPTPSEVHEISDDEVEEVEPQPKRRKSSHETSSNNVQQRVAEFEKLSSSSAPGSSSAPLKDRMQPKQTQSKQPNIPAQWGSSNEIRRKSPTPLNLDKKDQLRKVGKIPKKAPVASPAVADPIATSATPFIKKPNTRSRGSTTPRASTSTYVEDTYVEDADTARSPVDIEEVAPPSRSAPTPISRPTGSRDDIRLMRLRHCAIGFRDLGISGSARYWLGLTRDFRKLFIIAERDDGARDQLLEVNVAKGHLEAAMAVYGDTEIALPVLQLKLGLSAISGGSMSDCINVDNARNEEDTLVVVPEKADPSWNQSWWETKFLKELKKANGGLGQIKNSGARQLWESWSMRCQLAERTVKHQADNRNRTTLIPRTLPPADHGPRLPRVIKKGPTARKPTGQLTLTQSMGARRSARLSGTDLSDAYGSDTRAAALDPDEVILVYPPSGRGSVNITNGDLSRLAPGDYLNDSLIEFGLKIWLDNLRKEQPELADQIHVFSSFFYKKLGTNAETGYASVRKWTNKINIFEKKYLVIPINENFHWYLAIVYEPGRILQPPPPSNLRQSTRLKGDKPDINLADSQTSMIAPETAAEPNFVAATPSDAGPADTSAARDAREEMEVDSVLNPVTGGDSPLSEVSNLDLVYPHSSSPEGGADVDMEDVSQQAGPSRRSSSETLDDPPATGNTLEDETSARKKRLQSFFGGPANTNGSVNVSSFYADAPAPRRDTKGKGRAEPEYMDLPDDTAVTAGVASMDMTADDIEVADDAPANPGDAPSAYVFTFDSLGGRHKAAGTRLSTYLQLEAKDKMNIELSASSPAQYMMAQVPTQPNSCDCGVYLLHFAKQFMLNAEDIVTYITTKQARSKAKSAALDEHWDPESVEHARAKMRETIENMSDLWKVERHEEQEKKQKEKEEKEAEAKRAAEAAAAGTGEGAAGAIHVDSDNSDDDIQVLDGPSPKTKARKSAGGAVKYGGKRGKR